MRAAAATTATHPMRLERGGVFLLWEVRSCSNTVPELGRIVSIYAARIYYDPTPGGDGPSAGGKRRLIREEGFVSRVSDHVQPRDPGGGGTVPTVLPRRMTNDDVSDTPKLSGGGDLSRSPPQFQRCGSRRPWLGTLQDGSVRMKILECGRRLAQRRCQVVLCLIPTLGRRMGEGTSGVFREVSSG